MEDVKLEFPTLPQCKEDAEEWTYPMRREMQEILPGLFLGPYSSAMKSKLPILQKHGITHIICIRQNIEANFIKPNFQQLFSFFNKWCWDNWISITKRMKEDPCLTPYTRINVKGIQDLHKKARTIKLLEKNLRKHLQDLVVGGGFLDLTPKHMHQKKNREMEPPQIEHFCTSQDFVKRVKSQPVQWEKVFGNHISDKGLISRIYTEVLQLNDKKTT
ncbi:serine/threonine/tyrosine-interacting protein isoform X2 [Dasypus novemcinctus]|uniref:serine/threonine/tyrosine-interacting protein isoform X2 n=1 Tax=Dasypus novemcinctus TaxID=9361 RepID=UPI00265FDE73|nr:serine/threonine/tyrosine-interacting protein isoform X2 [Dasypus novemcinctus]